MTDLRTAAQQALKVLEAGTDVDPIFAGETEAVLRAALAQQAEPTGKQPLQVESVAAVAENATTQQRVVEAPPSDYRRGYWDGFNIGKREGRIEAEDAAKKAEPVEPVAWMLPGSDSIITAETKAYRGMLAENWTLPLYAAPPRCPNCAALAQQDEPLNLADPAVQKRLATQWGYVPAAQAEPVEPVAQFDMNTMPEQADAHLRALLRYTENFYATAIEHGMRAGPTANAIAHVERAGKALHQIVRAQAKMLEPARPVEPVKPVAWVNQANLASARLTRDRGGQGDTHTWSETRSNYHGVPLYTAPPQRKPLTEQEIEPCRQQGYAHAGLSAPFDFGKAARAVERAHGIKE